MRTCCRCSLAAGVGVAVRVGEENGEANIRNDMDEANVFEKEGS